jgi:hypothetical protein
MSIPPTPQQQQNEDSNNSMMMSLESITEGKNPRGIPAVKFLDDIDAFAKSFDGEPASPELLIGAYSDILVKYKQMEVSLDRKSK